MILLRQSTAGQNVLLGPFKDSSDFITSETALTINAADIRLSKDGANIVGKNSGGATHDELGWYQITLDATDTNTVGSLDIICEMAGALQVFVTCTVVEEAIFDSIYAAGATLATKLAVLDNFSFDASGFVEADVRRMNDNTVFGSGITSDKWRGS